MFVVPFSEIRMANVPIVGGKTASLGELISIGMPVPDGFAITAEAYRYYITKNLLEGRIKEIIGKTNVKNIRSLEKGSEEIRRLVMKAKMPENLEADIFNAFKQLGANHVAVRSSATAEDMPDASFAGQQESFLNVTKEDLIDKVKACFASLFTARAISYREDKKFDHFKIALSVAVQRQVFSKASGVMFTLDPDSGHKNFIYINGGWGLGDYIVQGIVTPDEFLVLKDPFSLIEKKLGTQKIMEVRSKHGVKRAKVPEKMQKKYVLSYVEVLKLAQYGKKIEEHYKRPMDIEWAKDEYGLFIIQARPETVHSQKRSDVIYEYKLIEKSKVLLTGEAIGRKIGSGDVNVILNPKEIKKFKKGQVLVTDATDPDWEPIMKIAGGIITEKGGRTSHAAIVSRELGVPCIVGVKGARNLKKEKGVTIDCISEQGKVWKGKLKFNIEEHKIDILPKTKTKIYVNVGEPDTAMTASQLPVDGVGLAREEFIISSSIGEHPMHLLNTKREEFFIERLAMGIGKIAGAFYPRPVIVRLSDFKTNEYRNLKGGEKYEIEESNPMIGWRGASRYIHPNYEKAFRMECKALRKVILEMKLSNVKIMIPFCRTIEEAKKVLEIIQSEKVYADIGAMAEIPSNIILADQFSKYFSFFSIGSNDLTQLTLGIDRDSEILAPSFNERNKAIKRSIEHLIRIAHKHGRTVGICGEAPSYYPDFTEFLVKNNIDSISVSPEVAIKTIFIVSEAEKNK